jgi:hypothetical protein
MERSRKQSHQHIQHFAESQSIQVSNMKMQKIQFVSMMMVIQMKLTKVIGNLKNTMSQEFQLNRESKLIQVSNVKMHSIQFVSMIMVIQIKLMKAIYMMTNLTE